MNDSIKQKFTNAELIIVLATLIWGGAFAYYVYSLGLTTVFVDQNSHLNIARLISDSMTPGVSQIGFWPPLLHILMAPFARIDALFTTGFAGATVLVPILAWTNIYVYRSIKLMSHSVFAAVSAVIFFTLNPYVLYYAATPMTEVLFLWATFGTLYFMLRWINTSSFAHLIFLGIFAALVSVTRFEGLFIVAFTTLFVIARLIQKRTRYHEIEGMTILFGLVAGLGVMFTFVYGLVYAGNPIEFISGQWSAPTQQKSIFLPTAGDLGLSLYYLIEAMRELISPQAVTVGLVSAIGLIYSVRNRSRDLMKLFAAFGVLGSPFFFDLFALYSGSAVLYLEHLPPFGEYFNERYGLYMFAFVTFATFTFLGHVYTRHRESILSYLQYAAVPVAVVMLLLNNFFFMDNTAFFNEYEVVRKGNLNAPVSDQRELAAYIKENYAGGKILLTRALHNGVTVNAGLNLENYILESNFRYFDQALNEPWLFARYVVTFNPDIIKEDPWRRSNEKITERWVGSEEFHAFYELAFENDSERLYVIKDDALIDYIALRKIDAARIPSLNTSLTRWDTEDLQDYLDTNDRLTSDTFAAFYTFTTRSN